MTPYEAGQQLGTLLFGAGGQPSLAGSVSGNAPQGSTYFRTLQQGASAQNAMQEARANRAKALIEESMLSSRQKLPATVSGVYTDPAQAALASAALGSNSTVDLRDLGTFQNPNARVALGQAATDMAAGNFPAYDQQTALAAGKPYSPVTITGTSMMPTGGSLGDVVATPVGQSEIGRNNAEAARSSQTADPVTKMQKVFEARGYEGAKQGLSGADLQAYVLTGKLPTTRTTSTKNTIPTPEQLGQYFPPGDSDPTGAKYSQAEWDAWRQAEAQRGVTNYGQMLEDFVTQGAKYVPAKAATEGTGTLGNIVHHIFGGTNEPGTQAVPAHFDTSGAPALGDAALTAKPLPSNVKIIPAPGTDPGVVAAMQAAAAAGHNAPAQTGDAPVTPTTQAEFDALPSGTLFVNPADGKTYRKK